MKDLEKKRAWDRAWRKRNRSLVKDYDQSRPERPRHTKRASRAEYFREYRTRNRPIGFRVRTRKPTSKQVKEWRKRRLEELSKKTITEIVTDPEILKLIEEQKKDDRTICVKHGFSYDTVQRPPKGWERGMIVYDENHAT